ncbi:unnamed protein product, partial [Phyllotreta striolata]
SPAPGEKRRRRAPRRLASRPLSLRSLSDFIFAEIHARFATMMPKTFFFCMSLKTGAWIMTGCNLIYGFTSMISGSVTLADEENDEDRLNLIMTVLLGVCNLGIAGVMISALIKGCERRVFLYLILQMANLFIISVFSAINMFEFKSITRSFGLVGILLMSILWWYGFYCMISFYNELEEYNRTTVKSGVIEITATNTTGLEPVMFPDKAIESTLV